MLSEDMSLRARLRIMTDSRSGSRRSISVPTLVHQGAPLPRQFPGRQCDKSISVASVALDVAQGGLPDFEKQTCCFAMICLDSGFHVVLILPPRSQHIASPG